MTRKDSGEKWRPPKKEIAEPQVPVTLRVAVALVHYPVISRTGEIIASAVTNLDLHDIARASRTFGVDHYYVVTPHAEQQKLVRSLTSHWTAGSGGKSNPDRASALRLIRIASFVEESVEACRREWGLRPLVVATGAKARDIPIAYAALRKRLDEGTPVLLLFGTAWGLALKELSLVDCILPPICGVGAYNHLSVRCAAAITLDRLLGGKESGELV